MRSAASTTPTQPDPAATSRLAVQLRTSLEKALGQHVLLSDRLIRLRVADDPGFVQAAAAALSRNTQDLTALITEVYGPAAGPEFIQVWESHEGAVLDYTRALIARDQAGRQRARDELAGYPARISAYLERLTGGALAAAPVQIAVQQHVDRQLALADSVVGGDLGRSYTLQREDYGELFGLAKAIAAAVAGGTAHQLPSDFDSPERRLQSALGELLGEHWDLAVDLMRAAPSGGPVLAAVSTEVNTNTHDLGQAMDVLFGPAAAQQFLDQWGNHLEGLVAYAQAPPGASGDPARMAATNQLASFEQGLSRLLDAGTSGRLPASAAAESYGMHDHMLIEQYDATARHDYPAAYAVDFDGYQHMFDVSTALAAAIGPGLAARVPIGGVHTGAGGLAP